MSKSFVVFSAALMAAVAFAQDDAGGSLFDKFDANRDGNVSQSEAQANPTLAQNFSAADTDADGKLTKTEFDAAFTRAAPPAQEPAQ